MGELGRGSADGAGGAWSIRVAVIGAGFPARRCTTLAENIPEAPSVIPSISLSKTILKCKLQHSRLNAWMNYLPMRQI